MSVKKIRKKHTHVSPKAKHVGQTLKNGINQRSETKKSIKNERSLVVAHEKKIAKLLAGNSKKVRDKVLKNLRKWLTVRAESSFAFVEQDFMRLWKGLYYCMWMSDKPLIQEDLAESLSKLVHCFTNNREIALLYTKCTLWTLANEWFGLDHYRIDKFQMLVRRIIRQIFEICKKKSWDRQWVEGVAKIIESILVEKKITIGFSLHMTELYLEELAKVSGGNISKDIVVELVRPFAIQLAGMDDERQIRHVMKHIFRYLIFQSDVGLDYMEKFEAWKHAGFPQGNIESMQKIEVEDDDDKDEDEDEDENTEENDEHDQIEETGEKPLDPRAGRVDVELPQIPFDAKAIADLVTTYRFHSSSTTKTRRQMVRIIKEFNELAEGKMPLGVKEVKLREGSKAETNPKSAALRLLKFEQELYSDTIRKKRKKKNSHKMEGEYDLDEEFTSLEKKLKSEDTTHTIKQNDKKIKSIDNISKRESNKVSPNKVKSKVVDKLKKKEATLKPMNKEEANTVTETPIKKRKKNIKHKQNGEAKTNLLENDSIKSLKNLNKMSKHEQTNGCVNSCDTEQTAFEKKSLQKGVVKKMKRISSEGSWCVSENISPLSPSRQNLSLSTSNLQDKTNSNQFQSNRTLSWLTPVRVKEKIKNMDSKISKTKSVGTPQSQTIKETLSSGSKKKVKIALQNNTAQHTSEYIRQLKQSPSIPFDANRKPLVGVLKPSSIPSPINPFYRRSLK